MAERRVTGVRRTRRGRTLALTNGAEGWSPVPAAVAAQQIMLDLHSYVVDTGGQQTHVRVVHGPRGNYLRTAADATEPDNLDRLPADELGNRLTGDFDVLIQIDAPTIGASLAAMHAAGAIGHRAGVVSGDDVGVLVLGAPQIDPLATTTGTATARLRTPFIAWVRPSRVLDDPGVTATGTVDAAVACYTMVEGDGSITLATDWSGTRERDVTVVAADSDVRARVTAAALSWAREAGGRYPVPSTEAFGQPAAAGIRFVRTPGGATAAQVGLDLTPTPGAAFPVATDEPLRLALSGTWVVRQVLEALRVQFGDLPPPYGAGDVDLGGGARLTALDVEPADQALFLYGALRAGPTSAHFTATVRLSGSTPGSVRATVEDLEVEVDDLLSKIGDFLSGGAVRGAIADGVRSAVAGGGTGGLAELLSRTVVRATAAAGSTATVRLDAKVTSLELTRFGASLTGTLTTGAPRPVVARLAALPIAGRWRLLDAMASWAPAGHITAVQFDFGDGQGAVLAGDRAALAVPHEYGPGRWTASVTVTDAAGRTASSSVSLRVS